MNVTIGGERLGSGNKMQTYLHEYSRSTHNLTKKVQLSMAPGVLVPFYCNIGLNGDTFDIDLNALVKTLPTIAPLFGSFKLQIDFFKADFRLYQGILHNNPINIGLQMDKVLLPMVEYSHVYNQANAQGNIIEQYKKSISQSSIAAYFGTRQLPFNPTTQAQSCQRLAIPYLAYYDIFKNYYANKQEEDFFYIGRNTDSNLEFQTYNVTSNNKAQAKSNVWSELNNPLLNFGNQTASYPFVGVRIRRKDNKKINIDQYLPEINTFAVNNGTATPNLTITKQITSPSNITINLEDNEIFIILNFSPVSSNYISSAQLNFTPFIFSNTTEEIKLKSAKLQDIDDMRNKLLAVTTLNTKKVINAASNDGFYSDIFGYIDITTSAGLNRYANMQYPMNGLCVKTYQSDIFNNWLSSETIDGLNGIAAVTSIDTSENSFTIDTLNLAEKVYLMLNRIAVAGSTYQDYLKAVYGEEVASHHETPEYCGGMSSEIVFEELVSTAETIDKPQGTLAGKGVSLGKKGGHITIKPKEPCVIIGIASITPRIVYTQGNKWYAEELKSTFDLHKPQLDGIGFQDLLTYEMAGCAASEANGNRTTPSAGKQPAWLNYMTDFDEAYGDFAEESNAEYMVLSRQYDIVENEDTGLLEIGDLTTYIDPLKFSYPFASNELNAQNFWVQIMCNVIARRKMSAKIIPNL